MCEWECTSQCFRCVCESVWLLLGRLTVRAQSDSVPASWEREREKERKRRVHFMDLKKSFSFLHHWFKATQSIHQEMCDIFLRPHSLIIFGILSTYTHMHALFVCCTRCAVTCDDDSRIGVACMHVDTKHTVPSEHYCLLGSWVTHTHTHFSSRSHSLKAKTRHISVRSSVTHTLALHLLNYN